MSFTNSRHVVAGHSCDESPAEHRAGFLTWLEHRINKALATHRVEIAGKPRRTAHRKNHQKTVQPERKKNLRVTDAELQQIIAAGIAKEKVKSIAARLNRGITHITKILKKEGIKPTHSGRRTMRQNIEEKLLAGQTPREIARGRNTAIKYAQDIERDLVHAGKLTKKKEAA